MKFKVGDRVRCTRNVGSFDTKGKVGTIKEIGVTVYAVDFDENVGGWGDRGLGIKEGHGVSVKYEDLELIEENTKQFTLADLKVGYLVELRDGKLRMVMESTNGKVLVDESGSYLKLGGYNDNFKDKDGDDRYDIMKVYGFDEYAYKTLGFNTEDRELLWESKEILDDKEKEYLGNFIKPFKDKIKYISKYLDISASNYFISIEYENDLDTNFPCFSDKEMYKGMETNKKYTLEKLGL